MSENQIDPLKEMFKMFANVEPPAELRGEILDQIHSRVRFGGAWFLKPVLVMASFLVVAFLGMSASVRVASRLLNFSDESPLMHWAQTNSEYQSFHSFPKKEV